MLMNTFSPKQNTVILKIYQNNNDTMIQYDIQKQHWTRKFARSHLKEHLNRKIEVIHGINISFHRMLGGRLVEEAFLVM